MVQAKSACIMFMVSERFKMIRYTRARAHTLALELIHTASVSKNSGVLGLVHWHIQISHIRFILLMAHFRLFFFPVCLLYLKLLSITFTAIHSSMCVPHTILL